MTTRKDFHNYKIVVVSRNGEETTFFCRKFEAKDGFLKLKGVDDENSHMGIPAWNISGFDVKELLD